MHFGFLVTAMVFLATSSSAQKLELDHCSCLAGGTPSDNTFTFRGRISAWNGNPTFRIWSVGTNRILGIRTICSDSLDLGELMPYFGKELWADFTVSAVTPQRPGVMQFVCIRSIDHPFLRDRPE